MSGTAFNLAHSAHLCGIAVPSIHFRNKSKELTLSEATATRNQKELELAASTAQSSLWENGQVLDYSFFGGTPNQHSKVEDTIQEWTWYANLTFSRSTPNNPNATLRIAFDPTKGSWSYVGNAARDCDRSAPTMNLGWISDTDTLMRHERGVILHQFGHVLGLMHEHEHPTRSGVRRLREAEILQYYKQTQGLDEITVRRQILDVYSERSVSSYSQHDPTSIMTYFMPASMNEGGVDIPEVTELSMFDKAFAVANYPRKRTHPRAHQWTPYFALAATGASSDAISMYLGEVNISDKRKVFSREMVELRLHEAKRLQLQDERKIPYARSNRLGVAEHALRILTVEEKVQNTILSLLFNIAPKVLLSSDTSAIGAHLDLDNLTLEHPIVQRGLLDFFAKLVSNTSVKKAIFGAANIKVEMRRTHVEKIQNGILSLLFDIAPKTLLVPTITTNISGTLQASLDPSNLTLDHPVVQRGLVDFFTKLASNTFVKKAIFGAVNVTAEIRLSEDVRKQTHIEKVQNGILSLLFDIAPKSLLVSAITTNGVSGSLDLNNVTLDHPVVQRGLVDFFSKLVSNTFVKKAIFSAVNATTELRLSEDIRNQTYTEKIQNQILSLLFDVAPKSLLVSSVTSIGVSGTLDPNNLTLEHPVVQHGLLEFFTKLASHKFVKKAIFGAVNVTAKLKLSEDIRNQTYTEKVQNGILSLLFDIAPKSLLVSSITTSVSGSLDLNNLTLDNSIVQRGLVDFFSRLASNAFVKKAIFSAVNVTAELKLSQDITNQSYVEKVQNRVLSLLFDIAPKALLVPTVITTGLDLDVLTLEHPVVQRGLLDFFTQLASHKFVQKAIFSAVNVKAELKLSENTQSRTHAEKIQDGILSLLFDIAPKSLLVSTVTTTGVSGGLDLNNLTLDNPIVQRGLVDFFSKLASHEFVKKAIFGAVNVTAEVKLSEDIRNLTYAEKIQNGVLSLLFDIAPKALLVPTVITSGLDLNRITLDHPVVQRGLVDFFTKLASNVFVKNAIFGAVNMTAELKLSEDIRNQTYAERVQNGILSLLFDVAPKSLLVSSVTLGSLDLNNLTLENPIVQRSLVEFFSKLSSNTFVKKAILGVVDITTELKLSGSIENGIRYQTHSEKVQNTVLSLLFDIAPKTLLISNLTTSSLDVNSLTLDHPIVQRGLVDFFTKLASNKFVKTAIYGAVNFTAEVKLSGGVENGIRNQAYTEKVQNAILSLLLNIAPKHLLAPNVTPTGVYGTLHGALDLNNITLDHPVVQRGLVDFFTKLSSNKFVKKAIFGAVNVTAELKLSEDIRNQTHAEKVQNGILYLLFNIAPKSLLVPNVTTNGASSTLYAALDPNNLTLDHPVVQRGLTDFFAKLTSNQIVKKAILGAVNITAELGVSGDIKNGIRDQTYAEKVQNGILSLLLGIAPKTLLAPNVVSSGALNLDSLTLDHPIVQRGLAEFFTKLASNQFVRKAILGAVNITAEFKLSGNTEIGIQTQTYAEKVQDRIFSLLFDIAPKHLLTPNLTALGISGTPHAALDLNILSLENSIVQRGLLDFFTRLASNAFVRKAILSAVDVTAAKVTENGSFGLDVDAISGHQLARLVSLILADRGFKDGVSAMSLGKAHKAEEYTITVARKGEYV